MSSVEFSSAVATFTEVTWDAPSRLIDGDFTGALGNGWSVFNFDTAGAEAADALLTLASPLPAGHYSLTFTIYQNYWNPGHILGDFALDYTTAASPTLSELADARFDPERLFAQWNDIFLAVAGRIVSQH